MKKVNKSISNRLLVVVGLLLLIPAGIILQLLRIQLFHGEELRELWNEQTIDYLTIPAERGNIYDSEGRTLVKNSVAYKIAVDPVIMKRYRESPNKVCRILNRHTSISPNKCVNEINRAPEGSRYKVLVREAGVETHDALQSLDLKSVIMEEQYQRQYNFGSLAAHALGFVNHKLKGMTGLEAQYDQQLKGKDGLRQVQRDRRGKIHSFVGAPSKQPRQGQSLYTTINANIQAIVEEELRKGLERTGAENGTAIIMRPSTGTIKAMASIPAFNPNRPSNSKKENRRNYAIANMIEPGSTFKLVTAIAALEQDKVTFGETFETPEDGRVKIHGQYMRDHDPLGTLTFEEVIEQSSNIATSRIAMRLEPQTFYQYVRNLGFGTATNVDLPHEKSGVLRKPYQWSDVTLPWMSIGYEVQVTPLQLTQAYAAFANGGKMMRPYMVEKIVNERGEVVSRKEPLAVRQIANKETIQKLLPVFKRVVSDSGTASWAQIEGLPIAGKTGTAQKYIEGSYQMSYRASFVGFFPADQPKYVCLVLLDEPKNSIYGGYTAGPVFKQIAQRLAGLDDEVQQHYLKNRSDETQWTYMPDLRGFQIEQARQLLEARGYSYTTSRKGPWVVAQQPEAGTQMESPELIKLQLNAMPSAPDTAEAATEKTHVRIPDLVNMNMRNAASLMHELGLQTQLIGSGAVQKQYPEPGARMKKGQTVTIRGQQTLTSHAAVN